MKGTLDEFSDLNIYLPKFTLRWREAFDITEAVIKKFRDSVSQHAAKFLLVTLSNPEQVHPDIQRELINGRHDFFDFEQPDTILQSFAHRNEIMFLKLMPRLKEYHLKTGKYLHGFDNNRGRGHWNENGHKIAAETIYEFLNDQHLISMSAEKMGPITAVQNIQRLELSSDSRLNDYSKVASGSENLVGEYSL